MIRVNGAMRPCPGWAGSEDPLDEEAARELIYSVLPEHQKARLQRDRDVDLAISALEGSRFRANVFFQIRGIGAVFRAIPMKIPNMVRDVLRNRLRKLPNAMTI